MVLRPDTLRHLFGGKLRVDAAVGKPLWKDDAADTVVCCIVGGIGHEAVDVSGGAFLFFPPLCLLVPPFLYYVVSKDSEGMFALDGN